MRYIPTAVLLVLAAVLGLYAGVHRQKSKKEPPSFERNRVFPSFKPAGATRITWIRDGKKVVLQRTRARAGDAKAIAPFGMGKKAGDAAASGRWDVVEPLRFPADREAVETMLSDVETLIHTRVIKGRPDRAEYKLSKPRITVEIEGALPAGGKAVLHVGGLDITERNVYVATAGKSDVLVVGKHIMESVDKGLADIRSKTALVFDTLKFKSAALLSGQGEERRELRVRYVKKHDFYTLVDSEGKVLTRAHRESVEDLKRRLEDIKITRFVEDGAPALAKYGLDAPERQVTVDDGTVHALVFGGRCTFKGATHEGERLAGRKEQPAAVFCVDEKKVEKVFRPGDQLRDLKLLSVTSEQLTELKIEKGGRSLFLKKDPKKGWRIVESKPGQPAGESKEAKDGGKAEAELIGKFLDDIQAFTVLGYAFPGPGQLGPYGLVHPEATLHVKTEEGLEETLELGAASGEHRYVRRRGEAAVAMLHKEVAQHFSPDVLKFRDRRVLKFERLDLKRITASGGGVTEVVVKKDGQWTLTKPVSIKADSDAVDAVVRAASDLKAIRYSAWNTLPAHGFGGPSARTLKFFVEPPKDANAAALGFGKDKKKKEKGPVTHVLQVGADLPEGRGCYARVLSGAKEIFELSKETCRDLRELLADRSFVELTPSDVKAISYAGPKGSEELVKRGPEWHRKAGPKVDRTKVDDLLSTVQNLKAARVLAYGKPTASHGAGKPYITVSVVTTKDEKTTIFVGAESKTKDKDGGRVAFRSGREVIYLLPKYSVQDLEKVSF